MQWYKSRIAFIQRVFCQSMQSFCVAREYDIRYNRRMINSKMLSQCLCQVNKCLLHNLKLNPIKLAALSRRIHSSVKQLSEYELTEQTTQKSETKKLPDSTENKNFGRLHVPVMMEEVVSCLSPQSGQCFLDMTFGAGGHSTALLEKASNITIYALDRDPTAYKIAQQLSESYPIPFPRDIRKQIQALLGQFSQSEALLISSGVEPGTLDGVLLDAGCSSMQFDTPERGFSLQKDGPLDMRMDSDRSTGTCVHPENIRGGEARQENRFSHRSGTQHISHHQNSAACKHCCSAPTNDQSNSAFNMGIQGKEMWRTVISFTGFIFEKEVWI
eukprot:XP_025006411.1 probable methyltransferase-like protein 15 isoform X5 [Gallus gallus]